MNARLAEKTDFFIKEFVPVLPGIKKLQIILLVLNQLPLQQESRSKVRLRIYQLLVHLLVSELVFPCLVLYLVLNQVNQSIMLAMPILIKVLEVRQCTLSSEAIICLSLIF